MSDILLALLATAIGWAYFWSIREWLRYSDGSALGLLIVVTGVPLLITSCYNSNWWQEGVRERQTQDAADAQPRVIREVDGCKVYAFKAGDRWHYFTRCPKDTTTESTWTEHHGKTSEEHSDTITTTNGGNATHPQGESK